MGSDFRENFFLEFLECILLFLIEYPDAIASSKSPVPSGPRAALNRTFFSRPMNPEERARQRIDLLLQLSGWIVQDRSQANLAVGPGAAIREALLKGGEADYLVFAGGKVIATVEAKPQGGIDLPAISNSRSFVSVNGGSVIEPGEVCSEF